MGCEAEGLIPAVEDDELRFEHDGPVDLDRLASVGLHAAETIYFRHEDMSAKCGTTINDKKDG